MVAVWKTNILLSTLMWFGCLVRTAHSSETRLASAAFSGSFITQDRSSCERDDLYTAEERWRISPDLWAGTAMARLWQLLLDIWTENVKENWKLGLKKNPQEIATTEMEKEFDLRELDQSLRNKKGLINNPQIYFFVVIPRQHSWARENNLTWQLDRTYFNWNLAPFCQALIGSIFNQIYCTGFQKQWQSASF